MKTLPATYRANGWNYKLVKRNERAAIYSQSKHHDLPANGKAAAYEVFVIQKLKEHLSPRGTTVEATEAVPSQSAWGTKAWTCPTLERAEAVYGEILAGIRPARRANGLPVSP